MILRHVELTEEQNERLERLAETADRYQELMSRRRSGMLSGEELRELLCLTDEAERLQAERADFLAELARLRGRYLGSLIEELGIRPSANV